MVGSLAQVGGPDRGVEVRPEALDRPLAGKPMAVGQGQQLHQFGRPPCRPSLDRQRLPADRDPEPEQVVEKEVDADSKEFEKELDQAEKEVAAELSSGS